MTLARYPSLLTDELWHGVVAVFWPQGAGDALVLYEGQEQLNKLWCVRRGYHIQHLNKAHSFTANMTLCMLGNIFLFFFYFFQKYIENYCFYPKIYWYIIYVSNNLDLRWGPTFCGASSGSKLFAKVIKGLQNALLASKELVINVNFYPLPDTDAFWHIREMFSKLLDISSFENI